MNLSRYRKLLKHVIPGHHLLDATVGRVNADCFTPQLLYRTVVVWRRPGVTCVRA